MLVEALMAAHGWDAVWFLNRAGGRFLREDWRPWLLSHPGAISLRISALRAAGRGDEADSEQARLDHLLDAADAASPPDPALPEP